ncbi:FeoB-associated Cys-rich membrane protein [Clostridium aestuarii]|uniref:FeoB-associated Cys-rich membrane protein n=1 Tax=Clostridium aestuarii TaxID=338193 RepID=A0ABT4D016_9CLOT|nr:FeoB-associated Cys-rich membrane protein [Clostridium aestuarii]MCY6484575.1 FeoB-associated Cys-rich membrane protein [Clostridium aestuarii]
MIIEIILTIIIASLSVFTLVKSAKKKISGKCDCDSCSSHCPQYNNKNKEKK